MTRYIIINDYKMKKALLLLSLLCTAAAFTACDDDDPADYLTIDDTGVHAIIAKGDSLVSTTQALMSTKLAKSDNDLELHVKQFTFSGETGTTDFELDDFTVSNATYHSYDFYQASAQAGGHVITNISGHVDTETQSMTLRFTIDGTYTAMAQTPYFYSTISNKLASYNAVTEPYYGFSFTNVGLGNTWSTATVAHNVTLGGTAYKAVTLTPEGDYSVTASGRGFTVKASQARATVQGGSFTGTVTQLDETVDLAAKTYSVSFAVDGTPHTATGTLNI